MQDNLICVYRQSWQPYTISYFNFHDRWNDQSMVLTFNIQCSKTGTRDHDVCSLYSLRHQIWSYVLCYGRPGTCYAVGLELSRVLRSCREGSLRCSHLDDVMDSHARKHQSNYRTALMIVLTWWKRSPGQGAKDECVNDKFISNKMLLIVTATERESLCFWLLHNALPWWLIRSSN